MIPETESLHYLQKSQGRPRRRILSTRLVLTSLLVCATCAQQACTRLLRTTPISRQRQMQVAETAGGLGVARMWHLTQNPPGFGPWGFDSPSRHHRFQRSCLQFSERPKCTTSGAKCAQGLREVVGPRGVFHWILARRQKSPSNFVQLFLNPASEIPTSGLPTIRELSRFASS